MLRVQAPHYMVFGTRIPTIWVLGLSGLVSFSRKSAKPWSEVHPLRENTIGLRPSELQICRCVAARFTPLKTTVR